MGEDETFDHALAVFAHEYADLTELDAVGSVGARPRNIYAQVLPIGDDVSAASGATELDSG